MIRYLKLNGTQLSWSYHQRAFCSAVKGCQFGKCKYFLKGFSFPLIELSCTAVHPWLTFITPSDTHAHLSNVWASDAQPSNALACQMDGGVGHMAWVPKAKRTKSRDPKSLQLGATPRGPPRVLVFYYFHTTCDTYLLRFYETFLCHKGHRYSPWSRQNTK